jgi:hypothetical protein
MLSSDSLVEPLGVGVLDAEDQRAVVAAREQPVEEGGAGVADVAAVRSGWGRNVTS